MKAYNYIDLFSGAGGFSKGFDLQGFQNIFSLDVEENFCKTYKSNFPNHHLIKKKIEDLKKNEINDLIRNKKIDVVVGGPPCQGFSIAGNIGRKFLDDPRNRLFQEMARVVKIINPKIVVIENVARLYSHNNSRTKEEILEEFKIQGYNIKCDILNSADYGVPQNRRRVIFLASNISDKIIFPEKTNIINTVKEAIDYLPKINSGESSLIPNHKAMNHSKQMLEKMSFIKDGGNRNDIPVNIRPSTGDVRKYIRYNSKKPSITITGDMRKVFHYNQNRALTVRELARLQSFEDNFIFEGNTISQQQQVGNAVPPLLAMEIAKSVRLMLDDV